MVDYMDMSIGRLLDYLEQQQQLDNTLIVFVSDNSADNNQQMKNFESYYLNNFDLSYEQMGLPGSYSEYGPNWASVSMTPMSWYKVTASEGGMRVPFLLVI